MQTFFTNSKHHAALSAIHVAVMKLSLEGYVVLSTNSKRGANIEIDRPYEGMEPVITDHGCQKIASIEKWHCRIYWRVQK